VTAREDETTRSRVEAALQLHLRYRFDPDGLEAIDRRTLCETAHLVAEALHVPRLAPQGENETCR
jgi:hypothetical protein